MDIKQLHGPSNVIVTLGRQHTPEEIKLSEIGLICTDKFAITSSTCYEDKKDASEEPWLRSQHSLQQAQWFCHKQVLHKESPYFAAMFGNNFIESKSTTIYLPLSIIKSSKALDVIIQYMYTHQINKAEKIKNLCAIYSAADYLAMNTFCTQLINLISELVHHFNCYCHTCTKNIPELLSFSYARSIETQDEKMLTMTQKCITVLTNDPEKSLSSFWSSRHMAKLLTNQKIKQELSQRIFIRIKKANAIESLYACFTASNLLSSVDPLMSWSKPLHTPLAFFQASTTQIIACHFSFFCNEYPALLSCIDGITYSFTFLEYLLLHVLEDQMIMSNVGALYQGIVCNLMRRHAAQCNDRVKHILNAARVLILHYITRRIGDIQKQGYLDKLDKSVLKLLADDLDVRPKYLLSSGGALFSRNLLSYFVPSSLPACATTAAKNELNKRWATQTAAQQKGMGLLSSTHCTTQSSFTNWFSRIFNSPGSVHHHHRTLTA